MEIISFAPILKSILANRALLTGTTPFEIIGHTFNAGDAKAFTVTTGLAALGQVLNIFGILSAAVIIVTALGTLVIVNYPKTVAQTKEKVANAFMTVCFIAAFPFVADAIYNVLLDIFY